VTYAHLVATEIGLRRHLESACLLLNRPSIKHEARLTGSACSMQDKGWNWGESFELRAGQPLLSVRLFGAWLT